MNPGKVVVFGSVPVMIAVAAALPLLSRPKLAPATQQKMIATQAVQSPRRGAAPATRPPVQPTTQTTDQKIASISPHARLMPTTRPSPHLSKLSWRAAGQLPESFQMLLTRSLFARDGKCAPAHGEGPAMPMLASAHIRGAGGPGGADDSPEWADQSIALRGVLLEDGFFLALMENPTSHHTRAVAQGALLAGGRVCRITLTSLEYEVGGNIKKISIGQNLRGETVIAAPTTAPSNGPGGPHGGPPGGPGGPPGQLPPGAFPPGVPRPGGPPVIIQGGPPGAGPARQ